MNTHKNARLTIARRIEMLRNTTERGMSPDDWKLLSLDYG